MTRRRSHPLLLTILLFVGMGVLFAPDSMIRKTWRLISGVNQQFVAALAHLPKSASQLEARRVSIRSPRVLKRAAGMRLKKNLRQVYRDWALPVRHELNRLMFATVVPPRARLVVKPSKVDLPAKPQVADLQPLGFIEWANGTREGILHGPNGIETVRTGDVVESKRILSVSPFDIEYAKAEPSPAASASSAEEATEVAMNSLRSKPDQDSAVNLKVGINSVGFVEWASGQRVAILANGSSVRLQPVGVRPTEGVEWAKNLVLGNRTRHVPGEALTTDPASGEVRFPIKRKPQWLADIEWANGQKVRAVADGHSIRLFPSNRVLASNSPTSLPPRQPFPSVTQQLSILHSSRKVADLWPRAPFGNASTATEERTLDPFDPRATFTARPEDAFARDAVRAY